MTRVLNQSRNLLLAERVERATTFGDRLRGLLGRGSLPDGHGMWIDRCNCIHTFFMRFPIDAVFVAADGRVVRTFRSIRPYRLTPLVAGAAAVLELPGGTLSKKNVEIGDELRIEGES